MDFWNNMDSRIYWHIVKNFYDNIGNKILVCRLIFGDGLVDCIRIGKAVFRIDTNINYVSCLRRIVLFQRSNFLCKKELVIFARNLAFICVVGNNNALLCHSIFVCSSCLKK